MISHLFTRAKGGNRTRMAFRPLAPQASEGHCNSAGSLVVRGRALSHTACVHAVLGGGHRDMKALEPLQVWCLELAGRPDDGGPPYKATDDEWAAMRALEREGAGFSVDLPDRVHFEITEAGARALRVHAAYLATVVA